MIDAKKICIVRLGGLGDIINTLPALDALRAAYPAAHIAWLVETPWADILPRPPRLNQIITVPKKHWLAKLRNLSDAFSLPAEVVGFAQELRAKKFDLAIDFHGNLRSGVVTRLTGAHDRAGFARGLCKEFNYLFTNRRCAVGGGRIHRIDRALALARAAGAAPVTGVPRLDLPPGAADFARRVFDERGLATHPVVAVHPGTSRFGAYKRWPADRYREIIRLLEQRGYASLVTWGPGERDLALTAASGTNAVIAPETRSVVELASLLSLCDAFIGADTGPALLAAAVDTPPVVIFGPKDPAIYAPRHPRTRVVEIPMDCRPCTRRTCDNPKCVLHITVQHVADAVFSLLDEMEAY